MPATTRKNTPRLRDGVMKRGTTWSYVIRVKDPETGISKARWVGGFATEQDAKAARDQARVRARQGQYIDRNSITVAAYLDQWLEAHAVEVKPKTLQDYRHLINRHVRPYIGELRLQAMSPARLTKLYRELATNGGRDGAGLSPRTVEYVHAVLRKAFRDAVVVDQILPSNPVERAKRPLKARSEPGRVGARPAPGLPRHRQATPAIRLLPPGRGTCRNSAHWCAVGGSFERPWAAKKRPVRPDRLDANCRHDPVRGRTVQHSARVDDRPAIAVARMGCCTPLLYGTTGASKNTVNVVLTSAPMASSTSPHRGHHCQERLCS